MTRNPAGSRTGEVDKTRSIKGYNQARDKGEKGKWFPNFKHSRYSEKMTTYDDIDYIFILFNRASSATEAAYIANGCEEAVTIGRQTGNMKEEVAAQKTAYKQIIDDWMQIIFELAAQEAIIDLMENPPRSDSATSLGDGNTGNTNIALFTKSSRATMLQELEGLVMPNVVMEIFRPLNFYWKLLDPWILGETTIPARYILPRMPTNALTTINTLISSVYSNQGEAKMHMDKFKIKYKTWPGIDALKPRELRIADTDSIAYLSHMNLCYRGIAAAKISPPAYGFDADGSENHRYYFKDSPNESVINVLAKLLEPYDATYNQYGGLLANAAITTSQNDAGMSAKLTESSEFLGTTIYNNLDFLLNVKAIWDQTDDINIELTGSDPTNADISGFWPLASQLDLKYAKGMDETRTDNVLLNWLKSVTF